MYECGWNRWLGWCGCWAGWVADKHQLPVDVQSDHIININFSFIHRKISLCLFSPNFHQFPQPASSLYHDIIMVDWIIFSLCWHNIICFWWLNFPFSAWFVFPYFSFHFLPSHFVVHKYISYTFKGSEVRCGDACWVYFRVVIRLFAGGIIRDVIRSPHYLVIWPQLCKDVVIYCLKLNWSVKRERQNDNGNV